MDDFANFTPKKKQDEAWIKEAETLVGSLQGKSEKQLIAAVYARAVEGKRQGTLTNEQIDAFYAQFSPMLDAFRRRKLEKLIEELKRID